MFTSEVLTSTPALTFPSDVLIFNIIFGVGGNAILSATACNATDKAILTHTRCFRGFIIGQSGMARCTGCGEGTPHIIGLYGVVRTRYTVAKETLPIGLRRLAHRSTADFDPTQSAESFSHSCIVRSLTGAVWTNTVHLQTSFPHSCIGLHVAPGRFEHNLRLCGRASRTPVVGGVRKQWGVPRVPV